MECDLYCTGWLVWSNKVAGRFFLFQKAMSEPAGKEGNLQHDIRCLITNTWAKRVLIVNSVITRYLNLATVGWSTSPLSFGHVQLHLIRHCYLLPVCYSLFVCCYSLSCLLFVSPLIHSAWLFQICLFFCSFFRSVSSDHSIFDYSVLFLSWYWKCVPGILIPITTTIWQINKHHTTGLRLLLS